MLGGGRVAGKKKLVETIGNPYTGEHAKITATTESALNKKIETQYKKWGAEQIKWEKEQEKIEQERYQFERQEEAYRLSRQCSKDLSAIKHRLLIGVTEASVPEYYESLKRVRRYTQIHQTPNLDIMKKDLKVPKRIAFIESVFPKRKVNRIQLEDLAKKEYNKWVQEYEQGKISYEAEQAQFNAGIDSRQKDCHDGKPSEVMEYILYVLSKDSKKTRGYYMGFQPNNTVFYREGLLVINGELPVIDSLPYSDYKFNIRDDEIIPIQLKRDEAKNIYNGMIYNLALRMVAAVFLSDSSGIINKIIFNGYKTRLDTSYGKYIDDCLLSFQISRQVFDEIHIVNADGKAVINRISGKIPEDFAKDTPTIMEPIFDDKSLNKLYLRE